MDVDELVALAQAHLSLYVLGGERALAEPEWRDVEQSAFAQLRALPGIRRRRPALIGFRESTANGFQPESLPVPDMEAVTVLNRDAAITALNRDIAAENARRAAEDGDAGNLELLPPNLSFQELYGHLVGADFERPIELQEGDALVDLCAVEAAAVTADAEGVHLNLLWCYEYPAAELADLGLRLGERSRVFPLTHLAQPMTIAAECFTHLENALGREHVLEHQFDSRIHFVRFADTAETYEGLRRSR